MPAKRKSSKTKEKAPELEDGLHHRLEEMSSDEETDGDVRLRTQHHTSCPQASEDVTSPSNDELDGRAKRGKRGRKCGNTLCKRVPHTDIKTVRKEKILAHKFFDLGSDYINTKGCFMLILLVIPILAVFGYCVHVPTGHALFRVKPLQDVQTDIVNDLRKLKHDTHQSETFWQNVVYQASIVASEPEEKMPSVVLFVVPPGNERAAVCLSHQVTDIVAKAFSSMKSSVKHDTRQYVGLPWAKHKIQLESDLFEAKETRAVVVYNLEMMHGGAAQMLHAFLDNNDAPVKRAIFALVLELRRNVTDVPEGALRSLVYERLEETWGRQLDEADMEGLVSRVGPVPVVVGREGVGTLERLCPL